jgi:hypothetical protein
MKKVTSLLAVALLSASAVIGIGTSASASVVDCIPSEGVAAYDETITEAFDEIIVDSAAIDLWYSWTGGPSDAHAFPGLDWQVDQGNHNGFDQTPGLLQRDKGNSGESDWFYHQVVAAVTHPVHHDAVIVHHDAVPPVTCGDDEPVVQVGLYCYDKLDASLPASWENSGVQTLVAVKAGTEDWTLAEKLALCFIPEESCDPVSSGSQTDWVSTDEEFTFPDHILYPTDNIGWPPIYNAVHTDLSPALSEEGCEPVVEPEYCVADGDWYTEGDDSAPAETADGLVFTGGSGNAVGYRHAVTGNLQGLDTINYTASGDLDLFYIRIVLDSTEDGGWAYDSLTVISEGPVNGSSIASSNKRGFVTHTLDEWAALLPNSDITSIGFHLDSGASADKSVTLVLFEGNCLEGEFGYPETVGFPAQFSADPDIPTCDTDGVAPLLGEYPNVTITSDRPFDGPGEYTITVTPNGDFILTDIPESWTVNPDGSASRVIDILPATGVTQSEDPEAACYAAPPISDPPTTNPPVVTPTGTIPALGAHDPIGGIIASIVAGLAGIGLLLFGRFRKGAVI